MSKIIYLIGASGSGKDAVLSHLREQLSKEYAMLPLMIAHRYISRDWQSGNENHIQLSEHEFQQRQDLGLFALAWQANGLYYGIGGEIENWRQQGQIVVVNGSRGYLPAAMQLYGDKLAPVLIKVDTKVLRQRLIARGRESMAEIEARLRRTQQQFCATNGLLEHCHVIHNDSDINEAVQQLVTHINSFLA